MRFVFALLFVLSFSSLATPAAAQFGVCDRAANDAVYMINMRTQAKINLVMQYNYPPPVIQAHLDIIYYSRAESMQVINNEHAGCTRGYRHPQQIVDAAVTVFSFGLNRALPPGMMRIDISEPMAGYPLGGPNALIPRARDQVLQGNSTPENIIRDPVNCLTFRRSC